MKGKLVCATWATGRDGASAIETEAVVLKHMRVGIAGHLPVLGGRRMAVNDHQAAKAAAPFEERLVDPGPVIPAELREGRGEMRRRVG